MKFIKKILNCVRENIFCVRDINKIKIFLITERKIIFLLNILFYVIILN